MDLSTIKDLYVGSTPAQSVWLGGTKVWERKPAVDIQSIFDAMVLWYDPKRQGATNENMAENPVLTDLSGNGHDATCYNFAWAGKSGIGSYVTNFHLRNSEVDVTVLGTQKFRVNTIIHGQPVLSTVESFTGFNKTVTIKIEGLTDNQNDELDIRITNSGVVTYLHNGENVVNFGEAPVSEGFIVFNFNNKSLTNITIEILPEYLNALVADGVDDYAKVEGLPLLDDYTVIAKREWITKEYDDYSCFAAKSKVANEGAFIFERWNPTEQWYESNNFGTWTDYVLPDDKITYQTASSYNGIKTFSKGSYPDNDTLNLFSLRNGYQVTNIALYSFILFNRTLTNDEIEWVKDNLIEGTYRNPEALLIDAWIFSGHTNEEAPTQITGEKGTALNCYNFAWNEDGSGFKDGYLCFDGVNDRLGAYVNLPSVNTVIIKYIQPKQTYSEWSAITSFVDNNNRGISVNYHENNFTAYGYNFRSLLMGFGAIYHNVTEDEVHTDYVNNYGRNGESFTHKLPGSTGNLYNITIGCVYNNNNFRQAKIAYVAIYSESLTDAECMVEIKRLDALWESRKQ